MQKLLYPNLWNGCIAAYCPAVQRFPASALIDYSASNNHGTLTNMDVASDWVASGGKIALDFDGTNDFIELPFSGLAYPFSLTCWFYAKNATANHPLVVFADSTTDSIYYMLSAAGNVAGDPVRFAVRNTTDNAANTTTGFAANTWNHAVAVAYSATSREVYLNAGGVATNTTSTTIAATVNRCSIGSIQRFTPIYSTAQIDDVRIYNRALSVSEIQTLALRRGIAYETSRRRVFRGGGGGVVGTVSITEADDTLASVGVLAIAGLSSITESADSLASTATISLVGSASITEASDTLSSASAIAIVAAVAITEASDTLTATGDIGGDLIGTLAITEADDTLSAAATIAIVSASAITEASDTLASTATLAIVGSASITEADDTLSTTGGPICTATAAITEAGDTLSATSVFGAVTQIWTITFATSRQKLTGGLQASCFTGGLAVSQLTGGLEVSGLSNLPSLPVGTGFLVLSTGEYLVDADGNYLIVDV